MVYIGNGDLGSKNCFNERSVLAIRTLEIRLPALVTLEISVWQGRIGDMSAEGS